MYTRAVKLISGRAPDWTQRQITLDVFLICLTAVSSVDNEVLNNVALMINISVKQTHFLHQRPLDHI